MCHFSRDEVFLSLVLRSRHKLLRPLSPNHCSSRPYCQRGPIRLGSHRNQGMRALSHSLPYTSLPIPPELSTLPESIYRTTGVQYPTRYNTSMPSAASSHLPLSYMAWLVGAKLLLSPIVQRSRDQSSKTPSPHAHPPPASICGGDRTTLLVKGCTVRQYH